MSAYPSYSWLPASNPSGGAKLFYLITFASSFSLGDLLRERCAAHLHRLLGRSQFWHFTPKVRFFVQREAFLKRNPTLEKFSDAISGKPQMSPRTQVSGRLFPTSGVADEFPSVLLLLLPLLRGFPPPPSRTLNRPPPPSSSSGGSSLGDDFDKVVDGPPSLVTPNGSSDASEIPITASTSSSATLCHRLVTRVGDEVQSPVMTSEELPLSTTGGGDSVGGVESDPGEMEFLLVNDGSSAQMVSVQVSSASFLSELPAELSSSVPSTSFPFSDLTHWSEDAAAAWHLVQEKLLPLLMNQLLASERVALKFYLFMACALLGKEIVVFCRRVWRLVDPAVSNGSSFLSSLSAAVSSPEPLVFSDRVSLRCLNLEPLDMSDVTICLPGPIVDPSPALDSDLLSSASPSDRRRYAITYSRRRGRAPPLFLVRRSRRLMYSGASSDGCLKRALARKASKNGDSVPPPPARSMMDSLDGRPLLGSHFSSAVSSLSSLSLDDQVRNLGFSISGPATLVAKALHDLNVDANSSA
ncbi:hypothetical protein Cni_G07571 [Canna indica]|uniref:Uncharacterized protein n=1 Tax=Canna indica TaxID=4628 RepID=A0AAQ3Q7N7_9LILI|nr:hypothetical protein Cni_G07571 [Canna indica]